MSFYVWLGQQTGRGDGVGAFARSAMKDKVFPRAVNRLGIILSRYQGMPDQREAAKAAHREWRRARRPGRAA